MIHQARNGCRGKFAQVDHPQSLPKTEPPFGRSAVLVPPSLGCRLKRLDRVEGIETATPLQQAKIVAANEIRCLGHRNQLGKIRFVFMNLLKFYSEYVCDDRAIVQNVKFQSRRIDGLDRFSNCGQMADCREFRKIGQLACADLRGVRNLERKCEHSKLDRKSVLGASAQGRQHGGTAFRQVHPGQAVSAIRA